MSRLEELINELCPNGVEYKPLNEVAPYSKTRIDASTARKKQYEYYRDKLLGFKRKEK